MAISEPASGQIKFAVSGKIFRIDGVTFITGDSGNLLLAGVNSITVNQDGGDDTANVGAFAFGLPSLTIKWLPLPGSKWHPFSAR